MRRGTLEPALRICRTLTKSPILTEWLLQEALADAADAGLVGIAPNISEPTSGSPTQSDTATASELRARNISELWLRRYLSPQQLEALGRLSIFAATFDAVSAAGVLHGADASRGQVRDAAVMLRCLRGLSVLQEVQQAAAGLREPRYSMHLLVRSLAVEVQRRQPVESKSVAVTGFIDYLLNVGLCVHVLSLAWSPELRSEQAGSCSDASAVAMHLMAVEEPNTQAMLRMLARLEPPSAAALLQDDTDPAARRRASLDRLADALAVCCQPGLALEAARAAHTARQPWPDAEATLAAASRLSAHLLFAGQPQAAVSLERRTLRDKQRLLEPEHPSIVTSMNNLCVCLFKLGQSPDARDMAEQASAAQQAAAARQRSLRPEHPAIQCSLGNLRISPESLWQHQEAVAMSRQALAALGRVLGPGHPATLHGMSILSDMLAKLGHHHEAADMARQALAARQRLLGPEHPLTLCSLSDLSTRLAALGRYQEAADMARQALAARQLLLGPGHPDTVVGLHNLSIWLARLGQHQAAADLAWQTMASQQRVLRREQLQRLFCVNHTSDWLTKSSEHHDTAGMKTRQARQRVLWVERLDMVRSLGSVSLELFQLGKHQQAAHTASYALTIRQRVLGAEHPDTLHSLCWLSKTVLELGRHLKGVERARQALAALPAQPEHH